MADQAVLSGTNFLAAVIVGRFCGLHELGLYSLGFAVLVLLAVVHEGLMGTPYTVFRPRVPKERRSEYVGTVLAMQALLSLGGSLGLAAFAALVFAGNGSAGMGRVLCALAVGLPFYLLRQFLRQEMSARLDVAGALFWDTAQSALQLGGLIMLAWQAQLSASVAYVVLAAAAAVTGLACLGFGSVHAVFRRRGFLTHCRRHWLFGRWICASQIVDVLQGHTLPWLLAAALGAAATGVYAACNTIVLAFNPLLFSAANLLMPCAAEVYATSGTDDLRRLVRKATVVLGTGGLVLSLAILVFGDAALRFLYNGSVSGGHTLVLALLAFAMVAAAVGLASDQAIRVVERPDVAFKARAAGLAVTVTTAVAGITLWGVPGAAASRLMGLTFASAVQCVACYRLMGRKPTAGELA
jgi:O-antigen/teichoic acid export membrane protein